MTKYRRTLLCSTVLLGAISTLAASPGWAHAVPQDVPVDASTGQDPTEIDDVVVTGSRIRQRDLTANSPIETITNEELTNSATLTVETFLNTLPQVVPSASTAANNPDNNGAANLDLRGLGPNRNLVLLNGRRIVGSDELNVVDVATIPVALVDRIELITGGASAVYGADAVAGVVNFILRDDFEGVATDLQGVISERGDAIQYEGSVTMGGNFADDRGNAVINFSYSNREELGKGARELTAQAGATTSFFPSGTYRTAGNAPTAAAVNAVFGGYGVSAGSVLTTGGNAGFGFNGDGTLFATGDLTPQFNVQNFRRNASEIATRFFPNIFSYNFEPENILIMPLERKTLSAFVNYDLSDRTTVYGQAIMSHYIADTQSAASPAPTSENPLYPGTGLNEFTIPVTNPFIPADLARLLASRTGDNPVLNGVGANEEIAYRFRASSLGPRRETNQINNYNVIVGTRFELGSDWRGDTHFSYGQYLNNQVQSGNVRVRRFEQLLDSPTGGTEFCAGGFNPFGVGLSPACAAYVGIQTKNQTTIEQFNAVLSLDGPIPIDFGAGPIQLAMGAEYRSVSYDFIPDSALQGGEVAGFNGQPPLAGELTYAELFGEAGVPLLRDTVFARALDLTVGYRITDAKFGGTANTYKAELGWALNDALRFRGGYQHAIRAPSVGELFQPPLEDNPNVFDPCNATAGGAPNPARTAQVLALCRAQGRAIGFSDAFVDAYVQGNAQVNALQIGNTDLESESADTITLGAVFRPGDIGSLFQNFSASVDYYNIRIEDVIRLASPGLTVANCYNVATNPTFSPTNEFCQQFRRGAGDFAIVDLLEPLTNQGLLETTGIDLALGFRTPLDDLTGVSWLGRARVNLLATYLIEFLEKENEADMQRDFAGTIGDDYGETLPEWKLNLNLGWDAGPVSLDLRGRYISSMQHRNDRIAELAGAGDDPDADGVGSATYWDLSAAYNITERTQLRAGVLNLFDREPESYTPDIDSNTDPSTYDVVGRRFFVGLNMRF